MNRASGHAGYGMFPSSADATSGQNSGYTASSQPVLDQRPRPLTGFAGMLGLGGGGGIDHLPRAADEAARKGRPKARSQHDALASTSYLRGELPRGWAAPGAGPPESARRGRKRRRANDSSKVHGDDDGDESSRGSTDMGGESDYASRSGRGRIGRRASITDQSQSRMQSRSRSRSQRGQRGGAGAGADSAPSRSSSRAKRGTGRSSGIETAGMTSAQSVRGVATSGTGSMARRERKNDRERARRQAVADAMDALGEAVLPRTRGLVRERGVAGPDSRELDDQLDGAGTACSLAGTMVGTVLGLQHESEMEWVTRSVGKATRWMHGQSHRGQGKQDQDGDRKAPKVGHSASAFAARLLPSQGIEDAQDALTGSSDQRQSAAAIGRGHARSVAAGSDKVASLHAARAALAVCRGALRALLGAGRFKGGLGGDRGGAEGRGVHLGAVMGVPDDIVLAMGMGRTEPAPEASAGETGRSVDVMHRLDSAVDAEESESRALNVAEAHAQASAHRALQCFLESRAGNGGACSRDGMAPGGLVASLVPKEVARAVMTALAAAALPAVSGDIENKVTEIQAGKPDGIARHGHAQAQSEATSGQNYPTHGRVPMQGHIAGHMPGPWNNETSRHADVGMQDTYRTFGRAGVMDQGRDSSGYDVDHRSSEAQTPRQGGATQLPIPLSMPLSRLIGGTAPPPKHRDRHSGQSSREYRREHTWDNAAGMPGQEQTHGIQLPSSSWRTHTHRNAVQHLQQSSASTGAHQYISGPGPGPQRVLDAEAQVEGRVTSEDDNEDEIDGEDGHLGPLSRDGYSSSGSDAWDGGRDRARHGQRGPYGSNGISYAHERNRHAVAAGGRNPSYRSQMVDMAMSEHRGADSHSVIPPRFGLGAHRQVDQVSQRESRRVHGQAWASGALHAGALSNTNGLHPRPESAYSHLKPSLSWNDHARVEAGRDRDELHSLSGGVGEAGRGSSGSSRGVGASGLMGTLARRVLGRSQEESHGRVHDNGIGSLDQLQSQDQRELPTASHSAPPSPIAIGVHARDLNAMELVHEEGVESISLSPRGWSSTASQVGGRGGFGLAAPVDPTASAERLGAEGGASATATATVIHRHGRSLVAPARTPTHSQALSIPVPLPSDGGRIAITRHTANTGPIGAPELQTEADDADVDVDGVGLDDDQEGRDGMDDGLGLDLPYALGPGAMERGAALDEALSRRDSGKVMPFAHPYDSDADSHPGGDYSLET